MIAKCFASENEGESELEVEVEVEVEVENLMLIVCYTKSNYAEIHKDTQSRTEKLEL